MVVVVRGSRESRERPGTMDVKFRTCTKSDVDGKEPLCEKFF